ncbi:MAG: hypothetical protein EHM33_31255 [Chloroflexi bacterium]|nr:MAG: hypothetical protein EHM33_31255 [Chloroflexota bacterium]
MNKVASTLAFIIGMMAVFAGGRVLLGKVPDYYVINWLPLYNYTIGVLTVFITALLIWTNNKLALPAAIATFLIHAIIMFILQIAYRDVVAIDSVVAMTIRLTTWFIILALMFFQVRKNKMILERG